MPYIKKNLRIKYDEILQMMNIPNSAGELNYFISKLCLKYLNLKGVKYQNFNEIIGVLECVKQEFYRKAVSKYEDKKERENGTIWK